jgi:two-component system OmpR family response regulator
VDVLLIDDERTFARNVAAYLESEDYSVQVAHDGSSGLDLALERQWSLIILDLNLPGIDGLTVCERLRDAGVETPLLMLTARVGASAVVRGLDRGADDYLTKPFDLKVLSARIRALLRREGPTRQPVIRVGSVAIDTNTHVVTLDGMPVHLAPREYALLEYLARHRGVAQDRVTLLGLVWGEDEGMLFSQTVDVHVSYLRKKLGHDVIRTVPGTGYLVPE